jgi:hypothetical protein
VTGLARHSFFFKLYNKNQPTSELENDNPFVKEVLRTGHSILVYAASFRVSGFVHA